MRDTRSSEELKAFVGKLRIYAISDQDDSGAWMRREFRDLFYIISPSSEDGEEYSSATWTGISGDKFQSLDSGRKVTGKELSPGNL